MKNRRGTMVAPCRNRVRYGDTPTSVRARGQATRLCVSARVASASSASRRGRLPTQRSTSAGMSQGSLRSPNSTQVLVVLTPDCAPNIGHTRSKDHPPVTATFTRIIRPARSPANTRAFSTA